MMSFEEYYTVARSREKRLYTDEEVAKLPETDHGHIHYREWLVRKSSCRRLMAYLKRKAKPLSILEMGCGNGWLCGQLALIKGTEVTGIDINQGELEQARRVFKHLHNLVFRYNTPGSIQQTIESYDIILFAASIQYFPFVNTELRNALSLLKQGGEIHITDSPWYKPEELAGAAKRSEEYYGSIEVPEMSDYYFHHSLKEISGFNYHILYNPASFMNKIKGNASPFHWICITNT